MIRLVLGALVGGVLYATLREIGAALVRWWQGGYWACAHGVKDGAGCRRCANHPDKAFTAKRYRARWRDER